MAFALPLFAQLFDLFQGPGQPLARPAVTARRAALPPTAFPAAADVLPHGAPAAQRSWGGPTRSAPLQRPLRVVRVVEGRPARHAAGRMVISGRMADVCAELDRLAELETLH